MKKNILFVVPARLGDAIMLTPALDYLKKLCPLFNIDILAFSHLAVEVFANNPNFNEHFLYAEVSSNEAFFKQYAFMVVCHRDKNALNLIRQATCPVITGYGVEWGKHQAEQNLDFIHETIATLVGSEVSVHFAEIKPHARYTVYQPKTLSEAVDIAQPYIVMHLGCHGLNKSKSWWPWSKKLSHSKAWPINHYVMFANLLKTTHPTFKIVLTGGETERMLADVFLEAFPEAINLIGATNIQQLASIIQNAALFLSGDTGSMHVACSTDTPSITFFASTSSVRTGPYPASATRKVLQADNIEEIKPEIAYKTAVSLLDTTLLKTY